MEKKKTLIDPSEQEIRLSFHNYKLLKKEEFNLKGSHIYFIKGPNEIGKSSILFALRAAMEIKDDTPTKVSVGETEGVNEFTIPGPEGKIYHIVYEFTDATTKFVIFDEDGNKISKITEMRNIFKYNHVDATEFIQWSNSAEGRRKQKEHILQLLPSDDYLKYKDCETTEKIAFDQRTEIGRELDSIIRVQKEYILTDEENTIQKNLEPAIEQLKLRETEYNKIISSDLEVNKYLFDISTLQSRQTQNKSNLAELEEEIKRLNEKRDILISTITTDKSRLEELQLSYNKFISDNKLTPGMKEKLATSVENGRTYIAKARQLRDKLVKFDGFKEKSDTLAQEVSDLTQSISSLRKQKESIITEGEFPVDNLSFDEEGYLTINGLRFDEHQTCESDTILIVAQLLCKMNISPIQILGDASLLDYKKLDRLYEIAEANGKIMFVDEIDRTLDKLVIVGYEKHDKSEPVVKEKKTAKKSKKQDSPDEEVTNPLF